VWASLLQAREALWVGRPFSASYPKATWIGELKRRSGASGSSFAEEEGAGNDALLDRIRCDMGLPARPGIVGSAAGIWVFAGIYFACYVPYTALAKSLSSGLYPGASSIVAGATLLPIANITALVVFVVFLTATGWWRYASRYEVFGLQLLWPGRWTGLSGVCTAAILTTTTLAYTFDGVSIVFVMLLMRGGVLVIAPVVDALTDRRARWFSWVGLGLALSALLVAFSEKGGYSITVACGINIGIYLCAYLVRLRLMSQVAKSTSPETTKRYLVEEQLVAAPLGVAALVAFALVGRGDFMAQVRAGFTTHLSSGLVAETVILGALAQGVILFGSLVFLDHRENTFSVPVNRSVSILAGVLASFALAAFLDARSPSEHQLAGAGLVVLTILVLGIGSSRTVGPSSRRTGPRSSQASSSCRSIRPRRRTTSPTSGRGR